MNKDVVKEIRKGTRRRFSVEEKIKVVLEGLGGGEFRSPNCAGVKGSNPRCTTVAPKPSWMLVRTDCPEILCGMLAVMRSNDSRMRMIP